MDAYIQADFHWKAPILNVLSQLIGRYDVTETPAENPMRAVQAFEPPPYLRYVFSS